MLVLFVMIILVIGCLFGLLGVWLCWLHVCFIGMALFVLDCCVCLLVELWGGLVYVVLFGLFIVWWVCFLGWVC